ncbi:hypothetical protein [Saccharopolyspora taberi]|uniref:Uncharacterized protein n=1 Tax=Saccharopolyspora taberi TaxID=60895 RepID=A0ABN3VKB0_9PSEU
MRTAPAVFATLTLLAFLAAKVLPHSTVLFEIPAWVTPAGAIAGIAAAIALPTRRHRTAFTITGVALVLLLWSAGGLLFDIVMPITWLLVPDWPMPDWPMGATRALALTSAILLFRALVRRRRQLRGECLGCGWGGEPVRQRLWLGYAGLLFGLPYPVLKTIWALGGTIGLDYPVPERDGFTSGWLVVPVALVGLVLSPALVHRWGRIWPRWVPGLAGKPTPRGLLLFGGWFGSALLLTMGIPAVMLELGFTGGVQPRPIPGMHAWPSALFYTSWFFWGLVLTPATRLYQLRTRQRCRSCDRAPALEGTMGR